MFSGSQLMTALIRPAGRNQSGFEESICSVRDRSRRAMLKSYANKQQGTQHGIQADPAVMRDKC